MKDLDDGTVAVERIYALVEREAVMCGLFHRGAEVASETEFWLAILGWTVEAFAAEAYYEFDGGRA